MKSKIVGILICLFIFNWTAQAQQDTLPMANKKVVDFAIKNKGKKVGNGECWTLAAEALKTADAQWDGKFEFGKKINYKTEKLLPGDIIQFKKVKIVSGPATTSMAQHTAIVYKVNTDGSVDILNQNVDGKKKVVQSNIRLSDVVKGEVKVYRPLEK